MTHHPECEDAAGEYAGSCTCAVIKRREAMEHVIHSSMPIDFERRYAMDNLIAQDADLIEICPDDLVLRLRYLAEEWFEMCDDIHKPLYEAAERIEALTAENKRLREALQETRWVWERHKYNGEFTHFLEQHICAALDALGLTITTKEKD